MSMSTASMADPMTEMVKPFVRAAKSAGTSYAALSSAFISALGEEYGSEQAKQATAQVGFAKIVGAEGGSVSARDAAALYGGSRPTTEEAVRKAARSGNLIAIRDGRGGMHFPRWQFGERGGAIDGLRNVLDALKKHPLAKEDGLLPVTFLLNPRARLGGKRPLDVLRAGRDDALKAVLRLAAEDCE
jgi:hypothetical protein